MKKLLAELKTGLLHYIVLCEEFFPQFMRFCIFANLVDLITTFLGIKYCGGSEQTFLWIILINNFGLLTSLLIKFTIFSLWPFAIIQFKFVKERKTEKIIFIMAFIALICGFVFTVASIGNIAGILRRLPLNICKI
ncbi:MAG: hypothetical protein Q7S92_03925 [Candidatus Diapherotrites archaeon]|nr:hypothetical protein [Candidatus Diapherotrites archaeon]